MTRQPPEGYELIPTGKYKLDPQWGYTIEVDPKKAPCPLCWGSGEITVDDGYDEDGYLGSEYDIKCPRCKGNGKYQQELEDIDG